VLALWLETQQRIVVGRLGEIEFPPGWYLYVGSAMGPGGLQARLARHRERLGSTKRAHWHVDYLRERAAWGGAWVLASHRRSECDWATQLQCLPGAEIVAPGFGSSDCHCSTHLVRVLALPRDDWFARILTAERISVSYDSLDELIRILNSGSEEERESAAVALAGVGPDAIGPLVAILAGDDADARWWAARALAEVGGREAVQPLAGALCDADPDVRACAALALGRIGGGEAATVLASRLTDESGFVASVAADALGMIGEPAVEALTGMLTNENTHARLLAVRALARCKSERAMGPLFSVLEDPSYLVRYYAREALEAQGVGMVFLAP
jgi:HEAT repeat protein/Uri superfamily endonuclease